MLVCNLFAMDKPWNPITFNVANTWIGNRFNKAFSTYNCGLSVALTVFRVRGNKIGTNLERQIKGD